MRDAARTPTPEPHDAQSQVEVSSCGSTVWVHSGRDGSCIGRFSKRFGIDVHHTGTEQLAGSAECIYCTHGPAGPQDWARFCSEMKQHHDVEVDEQLVRWD